MFNNNKFTVKFKIKKMINVSKTNAHKIFKAEILTVKGYEGSYPLSKSMIFLGEINFCKEGDILEGKGQLVWNKTYGAQIKLSDVEVDLSINDDSLLSFFTSNIKGVGKKTAEKIVSNLGLDAINKIACETGLETLKGIGISGKTALKIRQEVIKNENFKEIQLFIEANNLNPMLSNVIYNRYGVNSLLSLYDNPYKLIHLISFKELDTIGKKLNREFNDIDRIKASIIAFIKYDIDSNGNLYSDKEDLLENLCVFLINNGVMKIEKLNLQVVNKALELLEEESEIVIVDNDIYRKDYKYIEDMIVKRLKQLLGTDRTISNEYLDSELANMPLDIHQKEALRMAIRENFSVLSGLPGTGKTHTTNMILKFYRENYPNKTVLLMAPTGKASKRMSEMCNMNAQTLHRGLNIRPGEKADFEDKVEADFIIIDESSMIDAYMFFNLLMKIENGTKVLIIGDYEQLPSVGAGLILRDLISIEEIPSIRLTKIFRQAEASDIVLNSHKIIKGYADLNEYAFGKDVKLVSTNGNVNNGEKKIIASIKRLMDNSFGYTLDDICVLTPQRNNTLGSIELNRTIQRQFNKNNTFIKTDAVNVIKVNDRVMHIQNNYDLEVFNGEVGKVISIKGIGKDNELSPFTEIVVDYGDRMVTYDKDTVEELELAYAMTVHKSQGSEYKCVISVTSLLHRNMLNRNLIYTAWTRAKEYLIIVGEEEALQIGAETNTIIDRKSRIKDKFNNRFTYLKK